jgi:hypothetical protein
MAMDVEVIWAKCERKYFCGGGWTGVSVICPTGAIFTSFRGVRSIEPGGAAIPFTLRHCEPTGRAKCAPDDKLSEAIHLAAKKE